jgi:hypothetical protein
VGANFQCAKSWAGQLFKGGHLAERYRAPKQTNIRFSSSVPKQVLKQYYENWKLPSGQSRELLGSPLDKAM